MLLVNRLTKTDVHCLNRHNNIIHSIVAMDSPPFIKADFNSVIIHVRSAARMDPNSLIDYMSPLGFQFMVYPIFKADDMYDGCVVFGPILLDTTEMIPEVDQEDSNLLNAYISHLEINTEESYRLKRIFLYNTLTNDMTEPKQISETMTETAATDMVTDEETYYNYDDFTKFLKQNHAAEQLTMRYIATGNIEKLKREKRAIEW